MESGKPDRIDRNLFRPALDELFDTRLDELGDASCRDLLNELLGDEWYRLAERSCQRNKRPVPNKDDALNAFQAIKLSITESSPQRDKSLPDPSEIASLTLPELLHYASRIKLKHWIMLLSTLFAIAATAFGLGVWRGGSSPS